MLGKPRILAACVSLLYVCVALVFGVLHHHEHVDATGHDDGCAACSWQLCSVTDVPVIAVVSASTPVREQPVLVPAAVPLATAVPPATASRAPPVTAA